MNEQQISLNQLAEEIVGSKIVRVLASELKWYQDFGVCRCRVQFSNDFETTLIPASSDEFVNYTALSETGAEFHEVDEIDGVSLVGGVALGVVTSDALFSFGILFSLDVTSEDRWVICLDTTSGVYVSTRVYLLRDVEKNCCEILMSS